MEFSPDNEIQQLQDSVLELFEHVLYEEELIFISDEATIWDVSMSTSEELLGRMSRYYGIEMSKDDLDQPLWKLLGEINARRKSRRC
jgi:hypothetical protein